MLRIRIDRPYPVSKKAELVLSVLADGVGVAVCFVADGTECDILYSCDRPADSSIFWLPATNREWDSCARDVDWESGIVFIGGRVAHESEDGIDFDILCGGWLVLTGAYERDQARNRFGVPIARGSFTYDHGILQRPVVSVYVQLLTTALKRRFGSRFTPVERWPGKAESAIVLSHDLDRPFSRPTAEHYYNRIGRDVRIRDVSAAIRSIGAYVKNVVLQGDSAKQTTSDPNFGFAGWQEFERSLQTRSAFYVAVRSSDMDGAMWEEVNYRFSNPVILDELKRLADNGWEVGLHASIACRDKPVLFAEERNTLAVAIGHEVRGLRHHYWALDSQAPEATLRAHHNAGFAYDSSLGLNDAPGFRRGMAWPYEPIDPVRLESIGILQIPPTIMDGAVFGEQPSTRSVDELVEHVEVVRALGGAVVANWHVEQQNPQRLSGAGPALMRLLQAMRDDSSIFWASPIQLHDWWVERRRLISQQN